MANPADMFFSLGTKATKGDPYRKALFDYILLWIIFIAFCSVLVGNFIKFYHSGEISSLGWALFSLGVLWFQYFTLKASRDALKSIQQFRKLPTSPKSQTEEEITIENPEEMLKGFLGDKK